MEAGSRGRQWSKWSRRSGLPLCCDRRHLGGMVRVRGGQVVGGGLAQHRRLLLAARPLLAHALLALRADRVPRLRRDRRRRLALRLRPLQRRRELGAQPVDLEARRVRLRARPRRLFLRELDALLRRGKRGERLPSCGARAGCNGARGRTFASACTFASATACCPCSRTRSRSSSYPTTSSAPGTTELGEGTPIFEFVGGRAREGCHASGERK